jgi:hypothetical protein
MLHLLLFVDDNTVINLPLKIETYVLLKDRQKQPTTTEFVMQMCNLVPQEVGMQIMTFTFFS